MAKTSDVPVMVNEYFLPLTYNFYHFLPYILGTFFQLCFHNLDIPLVENSKQLLEDKVTCSKQANVLINPASFGNHCGLCVPCCC